MSGNKVWIYLATVPAGSKTRPALDDLTLVYQGEDVSVGGAAGWQPWAFNVANYNYDGSGDLLVVVCRQNNSYNTSVKYCCTNTSSRVYYRSSDSDSSCGVYSPGAGYGTTSNFPFTKFNWTLGHVLKLHHDYDCVEGGHEDWYECTNCHQLKSSYTPTTDDDIIDAPIEKPATGQHLDEDANYYCDAYGHLAVDADGLYDGQFLIATPADLKAFAARVNAGQTSINAMLLNDIDMTGVTDYVPAAYATSLDNMSYKVAADAVIAQPGYTGTFDGDGHVIKNLTLASEIVTDNLCSTGIFGNLSGTVKNLGIDKFNFTNTTSKDGRFGVIAGVLLPGALVTDCYVKNSTLKDQYHILGMIAGGGYGGVVSRCYVWSNTLTAHDRCGHIIGDQRNDDTTNPLYSRIECTFTDKSRNTRSSRQVVADTDGTTYYVSSPTMAGGEICYRLSDGRDDVTTPWRQTIEGSSKNSTPVFATVSSSFVHYGYSEKHPCDLKVYTNGEVVDNPNHQLVHFDAADAGSCITAGCLEHWKCSFCGQTFSDESATQPISISDCHVYPDGTEDGVFTFTDDNITNLNTLPFNNYYYHSTNVMLYTPEEVGGAGDISAIAFYHVDKNEVKSNDLRIYMTETTDSYVNGSNSANFGAAHLVYEATDYELGQGKSGWETFVFNKNFFNYSGTKNLVVIVVRNSSSETSSVTYANTTQPTSRSYYFCSDAGYSRCGDYPSCLIESGNTSSNLPIAQFTIKPYGQHRLVHHGHVDCLEVSQDEYYECAFCHMLKSTNTPTTDDDVLASAPAPRPAMGHVDADENHRCDDCGAYLIATAADLKAFADAVNGGEYGLCAALTADIDATSYGYADLRMGTSSHPYTGTFDGLYHTLNYNFTVTEGEAALFRYVNHATFKNIHVTGTLSSEYQFAGGLVSYASGATKFYNVWSSVNMTANISGDATYGGILARNNNGKSSTHCTVFENCLYDGTMTGTSGYANAGIVGWLHDNSKATLRNCLVVGNYAAGTENSSAITRNVENNAVTIENCYFLN
ncbi:MAG: hypothetical protein Q4D23_11160, partial [Bacteroidales bacterium]|nr:hypothetical protein [Bacteroidales bacterium]